MNEETVLIQCQPIKETPKAVQVQLANSYFCFWIPSSQILKQEVRSGKIFITVPLWFAKEKGIIE